MKKLILFIFSLFLLVLAGCGHNDGSEQSQVFSNTNNTEVAVEEMVEIDSNIVENEDVGFAQKIKETVKEAAKTSIEVVSEVVTDVKQDDEASGLPETFDNEMAFSRQAPFGEWEVDFYQEGCEEASLIMASKFFNGEPLDEAIMKQELDKLKPWEEERLGHILDADTEEVSLIARDYFNLETEITSEVTVERIKKELVAGNLVLLPLTGRDLGNPNFTAPGPIYHMLVVKGYDRDQFITNDPGTRLGKDYKYKYNTLINATHDWNGGDIYNGEKVMLIISQKLKVES